LLHNQRYPEVKALLSVDDLPVVGRTGGQCGIFGNVYRVLLQLCDNGDKNLGFLIAHVENVISHIYNNH